jgi:hypothetical protein
MKIRRRLVTVVCAGCALIATLTGNVRPASAKNDFTLDVTAPTGPTGFVGRTVTVSGKSQDDVVLSWVIKQGSTTVLNLQEPEFHVQYLGATYSKTKWLDNTKSYTILVLASGYSRDRSYQELIPVGSRLTTNKAYEIEAEDDGDPGAAENESPRLILRKDGSPTLSGDTFTVKLELKCRRADSNFSLVSHGFYVKSVDGKKVKTPFTNALQVIETGTALKEGDVYTKDVSIKAVDDAKNEITDPIKVVFFAYDTKDDRAVPDSVRVRLQK